MKRVPTAFSHFKYWRRGRRRTLSSPKYQFRFACTCLTYCIITVRLYYKTSLFTGGTYLDDYFIRSTLRSVFE
jgi:hypothetical protein